VAPNSIIVFHPGSKYLRFGRASDAAPQTILHAIARRRKRRLSTNHQDEQDDVCNFTKQLQQTTERNNGEGLDDDKAHVHRDTLFPLQNSAKPAPEVELARLQLSHTLQTWLKSDGGFRFATPIEKIAEFNRSCKRIKIEDDFGERKSWKTYAEEVNTVFGDEVLELSPDSEFNIHFPWRRGQLHLHGGVGGSLSSVVSDLKDIWSWCITDKLEIPLKDLQVR
jgi:actin-related protein 8